MVSAAYALMRTCGVEADGLITAPRRAIMK